MAKRRDLNETAALVVRIATGQESNPKEAPVSPATRRARAGGKKGGPARAKKLKPSRRRSIAKKAARARWSR
jgi:hypothetical protein